MQNRLERLGTVLAKVLTIQNQVNSSLIQEFYQFMVADNRKSDGYKKNNLKALIPFSYELAPDVTFYDICKKEMVLEFLNKRVKPKSEDTDEKWITTWNDYLGRLRFFFRWLYNCKIKKDEQDGKIVEDKEELETREFIKIIKRKPSGIAHIRRQRYGNKMNCSRLLDMNCTQEIKLL